MIGIAIENTNNDAATDCHENNYRSIVKYLNAILSIYIVEVANLNSKAASIISEYSFCHIYTCYISRIICTSTDLVECTHIQLDSRSAKGKQIYVPHLWIEILSSSCLWSIRLKCDTNTHPCNWKLHPFPCVLDAGSFVKFGLRSEQFNMTLPESVPLCLRLTYLFFFK